MWITAFSNTERHLQILFSKPGKTFVMNYNLLYRLEYSDKRMSLNFNSANYNFSVSWQPASKKNSQFTCYNFVICIYF